MRIRIQAKNVYGQEKIYPLDHAREIEDLTGCKTLTPKHINALHNLGFTFAVAVPDLKILQGGK